MTEVSSLNDRDGGIITWREGIQEAVRWRGLFEVRQAQFRGAC